MELELNATKPVCYICIINAFDENRPGMSVCIGHACRLGICLVVEGHGCTANDEWPSDLNELDALAVLVRRSHGDGWLI